MTSLGHIHFSYALNLSGGHQIRCGLQHLQLVAIKVTTSYDGTFWLRKCILLLVHEVHYFAGRFFSFHLTFRKTNKMDFWYKAFNTILGTFQIICFFNKLLCIHTFLLVWMKTSSRCFSWHHMSVTIYKELKLDNELICNMWLSIFSRLVIIWMVFKYICILQYIVMITIFSLIYYLII
jgi:hypothetical protein